MVCNDCSSLSSHGIRGLRIHASFRSTGEAEAFDWQRHSEGVGSSVWPEINNGIFLRAGDFRQEVGPGHLMVPLLTDSSWEFIAPFIPSEKKEPLFSSECDERGVSP